MESDFQENATIKTYRFSVGRNMDYVFQNYFADKLGNSGVLKMEPSAVWIFPDCNVDVSSASLELGRWIDITLLMPPGPCSWQWHTAFHNFDLINSEELYSMMYYPFCLSFEDSLSKTYITRRFWDPIVDRHNYQIPVVIGGTSLEGYNSVALPNSFINVKNFSSPKMLAEHMVYVARVPKAFKYYHKWRGSYGVTDL